MIVTQHVWRTNKGRFVPPGHPEAAFLAYAPGSEVADSEAQRLGLTDYLKARTASMDKSRTLSHDKAGTPATTQKRI